MRQNSENKPAGHWCSQWGAKTMLPLFGIINRFNVSCSKIPFTQTLCILNRCWVGFQKKYLAIGLLAIALTEPIALPGSSALLLHHGKAGQPITIETWLSGNQATLIFASTNLHDWQEIARMFDRASNSIGIKTNLFHDFAATNLSHRFYYTRTATLTDAYDWKNKISFPTEEFLSATNRNTDKPQWIKFAILKSDPYKVYYQDSTKYPFHYDFAVKQFAKFKGLDRDSFNQISLYLNSQEVILGAVLFPPAPVSLTTPYVQEYGIQIAGQDAYPKDFICNLFDLIKSTIDTPPGVLPVYMPSYEQSIPTVQNNDYFAQRGITMGNLDRWLKNSSIYSEGWAVGRLKYAAAADIAALYANGSLNPKDILLTDRVPSEIPYFEGILTLQPTTPNSHPVILARSYGIPFACLATEDDRKQAEALVGREILYQTSGTGSIQPLLLVDLESNVEPAIRDEMRNK